ncbi:unnamed protein product [Caenorhabditis sp. 36 PRJEB53466]|nr:unnamed protein product [Caenorhabditis sp. 36 PRJEB53466]
MFIQMKECMPRSTESTSRPSTSQDQPVLVPDFDLKKNKYKNIYFASTVLQQLRTLRDKDVLCDVTLVCGWKRINAHRLVLSACSGYFLSMFTSQMSECYMKEVNLEDIDPLTLESLVEFCYTGCIEINDVNVQDILPVACLLQLQDVQNSCCEYLRKQLDPSNCLGIRAFADTHACKELLSSADEFALKNFSSIVGKEEFLLLTVESLTQIIKSDRLNAASEELVFSAVIQWVRHDIPTRKPHLSMLLSHVRLPLCTPKFLVSVVSEEILVKSDPASRDLVDEAKNYLLLPVERPNMQGPRTRHRKPLQVAEWLYAVGGWCSGDAIASIERMDPQQTGNSGNAWKCMAPMGKRRCGVGVAVLENLLYAVGGHDGQSYLNSIERYDPMTNQWSSDVAPTATCRTSVGVAAFNRYLYAVGGQDGESCLDVVEMYDPRRNEWTKVASMGTRRLGVSVSVLNGCLYAVGGSNGSAPLNTVERYDPRIGKWDEVRPMLTRRKHLGTAVYDGFIYAVGGRDTATELNTVERYSAEKNEWQPVVAMNCRRSGVGVAVVGDRLFAIGGFDGQTYLKSVEVFDKETNRWKMHSQMFYRRLGGGVGVVRLADDRESGSEGRHRSLIGSNTSEDWRVQTSRMESLEHQLQSVVLSEQPQSGQQKTGLVALAKKKEANKTHGTKVLVDTNIRRISIPANQPIFKYAVQVLFVYRKPDGSETAVEMSKSTKKGTEHDNDKVRCQKVFKKAVELCPDLRDAGSLFYDRQASLYSLKQLKENIVFTVVDGVSERKNFVKAQFGVKKVDESFQSTSNDIKNTVNPCPANADRTLLEALNIIVSNRAYNDDNVITIGACVHYLYDTKNFKVGTVSCHEGNLYSGVGASKAVKTLEGENKNLGLYMTTEMKTTLFHPDWENVVDVLKTYRGFTPDWSATSQTARRIEKALIGLDVILDYGPHKGLKEDGVVMKIRGFSSSAQDTFFEHDGKKVSVAQYFKTKYQITLRYPKLFTIQAKGKMGKIFLPAELLILCPSQIVTNDQMINNEQADMIKLSAAQPHARKNITDTVVKAVRLVPTDRENATDFVKLESPVQVEGIVLAKPQIVFNGNKLADLNNPKSKFPTDFARAGTYYIPKSLENWEICFVEGEELRGLDGQLVSEMRTNGMRVRDPVTSFIVRGDIDRVFKNAKAAKRELVFFVIKARYNLHQQIKSLEQQYDLLTQEIKLETAEKVFRQPQTRLNIVNKTNMKLGGLNFLIGSTSFNNPGRLIIGFETSQRGGGGGGGDMPVSVGFAANMLDHFQKFAGGYIYVKRDRDIYGPLVKNTVATILKTTKKNRGAPTDILIYFNGVSEGQFSMINEQFSKSVKEACTMMSASYRPNITIIASSKTHNERLYKSIGGGVSNLEPGTVVDHTIVNPHFSEWYHASAVARQGTTKTTKFTVIFTTNQNEPLWNLETLTNDLCYDHQIVFHPVGLPVPLYIAGRYSQRGAMILATNGVIYTNGVIDLEATNKQLGYGDKKLAETRFNA